MLKQSNSRWEIPFQVLLHIVVFFFYAVNESDYNDKVPQVYFYEVVFFLNYALAAFIINYYLFPKFLYHKRFGQFLFLFMFQILGAILIEEFVLEKIYFPDTRGGRFGKILFTLLDVVPVTIILSGFKLAWDVIIKQIQVDNLKISKDQIELQFLKSQINPHFLFNNLNNLYSHALENSSKTPEIILNMSSLLRYMLYEGSNETVSLKTELDQLENFIGLYEMQIEGRGGVSYNLEAEAEGDMQIAPLILMVFVENAFKHSAANKTENISIEINVTLDATHLSFQCRNNYDVNPDSNSDPHKGIGLQNVKKRLDLTYANRYVLNIDNTETEFRVDLKIDLSS